MQILSFVNLQETVLLIEHGRPKGAPTEIDSRSLFGNSRAHGMRPYRRSTSAGNFAIYRVQNGRYSPVTIQSCAVERKQSRSFVQSKPVSWDARDNVPCRSPEAEPLAGQGQSPCGVQGQSPLPDCQGRALTGVQGQSPCGFLKQSLDWGAGAKSCRIPKAEP